MAARPPVIDADGHYLEHPDDVRKYLKEPWNKRRTPLWPSDQPWDSQLFNTRGAEAQWLQVSAREQVERWVRLIETQNFEAAILFPTGSGGVAKLQEKEFAIAVAQAVNDYVAHELNAHDPRVKAVGVLPLRTAGRGGAGDAPRRHRAGPDQLRAAHRRRRPSRSATPSTTRSGPRREALGIPLCVHGTRTELRRGRRRSPEHLQRGPLLLVYRQHAAAVHEHHLQRRPAEVPEAEAGLPRDGRHLAALLPGSHGRALGDPRRAGDALADEEAQRRRPRSGDLLQHRGGGDAAAPDAGVRGRRPLPLRLRHAALGQQLPPQPGVLLGPPGPLRRRARRRCCSTTRAACTAWA